jgi:ankyrin repeat protein
MMAAFTGDLAMAKVLIDHGADLNSENISQATALQIAVIQGMIAMTMIRATIRY